MEVRGLELAKARTQTHTITMESKRHLRITGVIDVESFHEDEAVIVTNAGVLSVYGVDLHLCRLNPDDGQVVMEGDIQSLVYEPPAKEKRGLFGGRRP